MPALQNTQRIFSLVFGKLTATARHIRTHLRVDTPTPNPTEHDENTGRPVSLTKNRCVDNLRSLKRTARKPSPTPRSVDALRVKRGGRKFSINTNIPFRVFRFHPVTVVQEILAT